MGRGGTAQIVLAEEGQIAVGRVVIDRTPGGHERPGHRAGCGIEILQPQNRGIGHRIGRISHPIDADARHLGKARGAPALQDHGRCFPVLLGPAWVTLNPEPRLYFPDDRNIFAEGGCAMRKLKIGAVVRRSFGVLLDIPF